MAITNAQQYKQLLAKGGRIQFQGGGSDSGSYDEAGLDVGPGGGSTYDEAGLDVAGSAADRGSYDAPTGAVDDPFKGPGQSPDYFTTTNLTGYDEETGVTTPPRNTGDDGGPRRGDDLQTLYNRGVPDSNIPGLGGTVLDGFQGIRNKSLRKNIDFYRYDSRTAKARAKYGVTAAGYEQYMKERLAGEIDAAGNPINQGQDDGSDIPLIPFENQTQPGTETETETEPDPFQRGIAYRFMADGGMTNDAPVEGGIMDLESGRQMYFLGKLVKKATRAVKKIAKSPIGKAALLYAGGSFLGGGGGGLTSIFGKDAFLRKTLLPKLYKDGAMTGLGKLAIGGGLTLAPLLFQEEKEQPDFSNNRGPGLDINAIRSNPYNTMGSSYRFFAEGGDVEPVAKETMPLIDMDGKEMDLRADGGFVPIGRMERADDVPARLSKNEFVFTADAVRNAGEGDIDKGAEVMYNMMKNLESGGEVSEESQGLDGAREMFQTSQRLEEVL